MVNKEYVAAQRLARLEGIASTGLSAIEYDRSSLITTNRIMLSRAGHEVGVVNAENRQETIDALKEIGVYCLIADHEALTLEALKKAARKDNTDGYIWDAVAQDYLSIVHCMDKLREQGVFKKLNDDNDKLVLSSLNSLLDESVTECWGGEDMKEYIDIGCWLTPEQIDAVELMGSSL